MFTVAMHFRAWPFIALLAACSGAAKDCTTIGCVDAVVVHAPPGAVDGPGSTLTVCVEDECSRDTAFGSGIDQAEMQFPGMRDGDRVTAVLLAPDGTQYEGEAVVSTNRPNGPGCDPVCTEADLTLEG